MAKVLAREGTVVKAGARLASLDDAAEQVKLDRLKALAKDTTRMRAAKADLSQKKADLLKMEAAANQGAVTKWELEHARLAVRTAELQVAQEEFQIEQNRLARDELSAQIKRLKIHSPFAGRVEEVKSEPGESAEGLQPVIRIVKVDPLWIDVPVPLESVTSVKEGGTVQVVFPERLAGRSPEKGVGEIIFVATVADAASDTLRVRVQVGNSAGRPAGERVLVQLQSSSPD